MYVRPLASRTFILYTIHDRIYELTFASTCAGAVLASYAALASYPGPSHYFLQHLYIYMYMHVVALLCLVSMTDRSCEYTVRVHVHSTVHPQLHVLVNIHSTSSLVDRLTWAKDYRASTRMAVM